MCSAEKNVPLRLLNIKAGLMFLFINNLLSISFNKFLYWSNPYIIEQLEIHLNLITNIFTSTKFPFTKIYPILRSKDLE